MQTFLAYADFAKSAAVLDWKRLGNQCYRECKTLLNGGWKNHPASKMWKGYEYALCLYGLALANEMEARAPRWKPEVVQRWQDYYTTESRKYPDTGMPPWLGRADFHAAHRSNLLRKDRDYYGKFGWTEPDNLEYVWPTSPDL